MAEKVQSIMDRMVPALRDLLDQGIFTEPEIKSIVTRRRNSEYLLHRRVARKADFLRYIEAEITLERLRYLRKGKQLSSKKANREKKDQQEKKSSYSIGDVSIVRHVHFIFARALRKWRDDLALHLQHAAFAKQVGSFQKLGRIYAEALQVHPRNTGLWIEAASHEYFGYATSHDRDDDSSQTTYQGGSIYNARILLQRGLRINPKSQALWLQSFALEFHYIQKLRGRQEILKHGLNEDDDHVLEVREDATTYSLYKNAQVPGVMFKNAIQNISDDVQFRLKFMDLCRMFPDTDSTKAMIMSSINRDFGNNVEAWIARASYAAEQERGDSSVPVAGLSIDANVGFLITADVNEENVLRENDANEISNIINKHGKFEVLCLLDEATDCVNTADMYLKSFQFLRSYMMKLTRDESQGDKLSLCSNFLRSLSEKADRANQSSPDLVLEKAHFLVHTGEPIQAVQMLQDATMNDTKCKTEYKVWLRLADIVNRLEMAGILTKEIGISDSSVSVLRRALKNIPMCEPGHLNVLAKLCLTLLSVKNASLMDDCQELSEESFSVFQKILILFSGSSSSRMLTLSDNVNSEGAISIPELALAYLNHATIVSCNIVLVRRVYKAVLFDCNYTNSCDGLEEMQCMRQFYDACICAEKVLGDCGGGGQKKRTLSTNTALSKLYDTAIRFYRERGELTISDEYKRQRMEDCVSR